MRPYRASSMSFDASRKESAGVTVGLVIYLCFKNTITDILIALVLSTHRRQ